MTDDRSLERAARSWLEEGPTEAPDRAVAAALTRIQTTAQERDPWAPWRKTSMPTRVALAAAVAIVAIGGAVTLNYLIVPPGPGATPSPDASAPTISSTPAIVAPSADTCGAVRRLPRRTFDGVSRSSVWVQSSDGSVSRELLPDEAGSWLLGRTGDGDRVLAALSGDEPSLTLVDVATGEQQLVPRDCPSDACWADAPTAFGAIGTMTLADDDRTAVMVIGRRPPGRKPSPPSTWQRAKRRSSKAAGASSFLALGCSTPGCRPTGRRSPTWSRIRIPAPVPDPRLAPS